MVRFRFLFFAALLVGLAALAHGGFDEGKVAHDRGDYATAYKQFKPLAEQGNAKAPLFLGVMYEFGQGVNKNSAEAVKWYRKAAEQGDAKAQLFLGRMYDEGHGQTQDYAEAMKWYRKAAEQGEAEAQYHMGLMHENGTVVPQNKVLALMWFNLAAAQDDLFATERRDNLNKYMYPAEILEAQRLAREWKLKGGD